MTKLTNFKFVKNIGHLNPESTTFEDLILDKPFVTFKNTERIILSDFLDKVSIVTYNPVFDQFHESSKVEDVFNKLKDDSNKLGDTQVPVGHHVLFIKSNDGNVISLNDLDHVHIKVRAGRRGCTDPLAENFDGAAEVDDGSCKDAPEAMAPAGGMGDPHILTFGGNRCELPHSLSAYKFLQTEDLVANIDTKVVGDEVFIQNLYVKQNESSFIINLDTLEMSNEINNNFEVTKLGELTTLIVSNDRRYRMVINAEINGVLIKPMFAISQENSSGILMSDPFDECVIENLY